MYTQILESLMKNANAEYETASTNFKIYLSNPVGVGEHPSIVEEAEKLLEKMTNAQGKRDLLNQIVSEINQNEKEGK